METKTIQSYPYQQYQDDLDIKAFFDAYNQLSQAYIDWCNVASLPIYSGLTGPLLDWVGVGLYGIPRPTIGSPSGAIYNAAIYNVEKYSSGQIASATASDDIYKRIMTWKLFRGDGFYISIEWLKRRMKRFLLGRDGATPFIDNTYEISMQIMANNAIEFVINYPEDQASVDLLVDYINTKALDTPFQYDITARTI